LSGKDFEEEAAREEQLKEHKRLQVEAGPFSQGLPGYLPFLPPATGAPVTTRTGSPPTSRFHNLPTSSAAPLIPTTNGHSQFLPHIPGYGLNR